MQPKRFDQARPFVTLALVVAAWLVVPVVLKTFLRASFFEFQAPLTVTASYARDLQEYWSLRLHSNGELIEAGRDVARLYSSYDNALQENASLHGEISRLEEVLRLPSFAAYRSEAALRRPAGFSPAGGSSWSSARERISASPSAPR